MLSEVLDAAQAAWTAGHWDEAIQRYQEALSLAVVQGDVRQVTEIFKRIGHIHLDRGELELAGECYEVSLTIAELNDLCDVVPTALISLANVEMQRGHLQEAEAIYLRSRVLAEALGDERLVALHDHNLGILANIRGDVETALRFYGSVLERYARLGDERSAARTLNNMGMACVDLSRWAEAEAHFDRALPFAERAHDTRTQGSLAINRAELFFRQKSFDRARESGGRALELFQRLGSDSGRAEVYKLYGMLDRETGELERADAHLESAVRLARQCGARLLEAESLSEWALVHLAGERNRDALQCLNQAHHIFGELSARRDLLDLDRRLDGLEATYLRVVAAWGESIESKDLYTAGHCERVANYACMLAEAVGIAGRDLTWLRMGGYLHDVGKIVIPAEVLNKPGKLTDEEFKLIQSHAAEGDAIVAELNFPWDIRPAVRWHHERWDGSGYPDGLKGEEIPLTARILCVADVYDALTTTRSYRPALSRDEALAIMERDVGRFFDPGLFPVFRALITRAAPLGDWRFPAFGATSEAAA